MPSNKVGGGCPPFPFYPFSIRCTDGIKRGWAQTELAKRSGVRLETIVWSDAGGRLAHSFVFPGTQV